MITQDINIDEHLNSVSIEAQLLFTRILSVSDDCGVVPANEYTLKSLTNPPDKIRRKFQDFVQELVSTNLLIGFEYNGKPYLCFKRESFERQQAYLIKNRTKSEYLKIEKDDFFRVYEQISALPENSGNNSKIPQVSLLTHKEIKDNSNKIKDKREGQDKFKPPTLQEVKEFFKEKGYMDKIAVTAFNHYDLAKWHDTKGNPVKNWKQKMNTVWFKDENRIPQEENLSWK